MSVSTFNTAVSVSDVSDMRTAGVAEGLPIELPENDTLEKCNVM